MKLCQLLVMMKFFKFHLLFFKMADFFDDVIIFNFVKMLTSSHLCAILNIFYFAL